MQERLRFQKANGRYYKVYLYRDLFGDWMVTKVWGAINSRLGNYTHQMFYEYIDARNCINEIIERRKERGYLLVQ